MRIAGEDDPWFDGRQGEGGHRAQFAAARQRALTLPSFDVAATKRGAMKRNGRARAVFVAAAVIVMGMAAPARAGDPILVSTTVDSNGGTLEVCSLREAIHSANTNSSWGGCAAGTPGADVINVPPGNYDLTITGVEDANFTGDLDVTESLTIAGTGGGEVVINAAAVSERVLDNINTTLNLTGLTITGGRGSGTFTGGGIRAAGTAPTLTLLNTVVHSNAAVNAGGGVFQNAGTLTITNSTLRDNSTGGGSSATGGGIFLRDTSATLTGVDFLRNVSRQGGGLYQHRSTLALSGGSFTNNGGPLNQRGGGYFGLEGSATLTGTSFTSNTSQVDQAAGGGIFLRDHVATISGLTMSGNTANGATAGWGGAISTGDPIAGVQAVTVDQTVITGGSATTSGGGIYSESQLSFSNSSISGASAFYGGGIAAMRQTTITHSTLSGNTTTTDGNGGGLAALGPAAVTVVGSTISGNAATGPTGWGGGVFLLDSSSVSTTNSTISGNTAGVGGGIYQRSSSPSSSLVHTTVYGNTASDAGDNVHVAAAPLSLRASIVATPSSTVKTDCSGTTVTSSGDNIDSDGSCFGASGQASDKPNTDPKLRALANNGGSTLTHALLPGSPALDGVTGTCPPPATDQRGVTRPVDGDNNNSSLCDIGSFESQDAIAPTVVSIVRVGANPASSGSSLEFTVTFSEAVTGVDVTDFVLTTTGVSGATVTGVTGTGNVRTVTVSTGTGSGTIRLDVADDDTIKDASNNELGGPGTTNGNFTTGEAYEIRNLQALIVSKTGGGTGTVTSSPDGIDCDPDCSESYAPGTSVTLTAIPAADSVFAGWSGGGCSGAGTCTLTMDAAKAVTANFAIAQRTLTVAKAGGGTGTVTSLPAGIGCGADCTEPYAHGTSVTLTADPAADSAFAGWSGGGCSGTGTCTLTMDAAKTVTATFEIAQRTLTVARAGGGAGTVTSSPRGINCGADCNQDYDHGTLVTLTATPSPGSYFVGWSGICTGGGTCAVTMDAAKTVTANFTPIPRSRRTLTVERSGGGQGEVTSSPLGINCGSDCTQEYEDGMTITLIATPEGLSSFGSWSGCDRATGNECIVTMNVATTVTARFVAPRTLTVERRGSGSGSVTSTPEGIDCGSDCTADYSNGSDVVLTATPGEGSTFGSWTGCDEVADDECTVSLTSDATVTAHFDGARVVHERRVTLFLGRHLSAHGRVWVGDGPVACASGVPVRIQRQTPKGWLTVERRTTSPDGRFRAQLPDRADAYRVRAPSLKIDGGPDACKNAISPTREHEHEH